MLIAAAPEGYQLTIWSEVRGERGTRVLAAPDCSSVADAGALSIALALSNADPESDAPRSTEPQSNAPRSAEPESNPPRSAEPSASVFPTATAPSADNDARRASAPSAARSPDAVTRPEANALPRNTLALQLLGDYGALPRVSPGFRLSAGRSWRRWSGRAGVQALLPATRWIDGERGAVGGRFWLGAGRVEGCVRTADHASPALGGCLVFEAGALMGSGVGVDVSKQVTLAWLAPGGRVVGALPLTGSRTQAIVGVEGLVPLLSKEFTVENGRSELHRPTRVVGRMDFGVAWQF